MRKILLQSTYVFLAVFIVLFLGMSRLPNIYDEGIALTAAMRVAAGQIPHRDFYINYGPAQSYILAGLFKLFGSSVLVERLYDLFLKALIVSLMYAVVSSYCRKTIAISTTFITFLWIYGLNELSASTMVPVSILNLLSSLLILPVFQGKVSRTRVIAAGAISGLATLFRYDTGIALILIDAIAIGIAISLTEKSMKNRLQTFWSIFWPYLAGFALVTIPSALYYLSVASSNDLIFDIFLYASRYYYRARNLPLPSISLKAPDNLAVYLPLAIIAVTVYALITRRALSTEGNVHHEQDVSKNSNWYGVLITFGLLTLAMYAKGWVRLSTVQIYLAAIPSLLLIAVLYQHRFLFSRGLRVSIVWIMWFSALSAALVSAREIRRQHKDHSSVFGNVLFHARTGDFDTLEWCKVPTPVTRGFCFSSDDDHIRTIEFILSHTNREQTLYVGLPKHDKIFVNDNLLYFATQRLPATKWSHFDPDLQNTYPIQTEMVHELAINAPPYIVLDSEFDKAPPEPNDSSKSTGVHVLDDYIQNNYQYIETFGEMSIWKRTKAIS